MPAYKNVMIFGEITDGKLIGITKELLGCGRRLADELGEELCVVLIGSGIDGLADESIAFGADKAYVVEHEALDNYTSDGYAKALADLINKQQPSIVLFGATVIGKDLSAKVAAKVNAGLATDCTAISSDDSGSFTVRRPMYAGKVFVSEPYRLVTVRLTVYSPLVL